MAIEHDYFGLLESGPDGSIFWSEIIDFGDQRVTVDLTAPDQDDVSPDALDVAASMISSLEAIDLQSRNAMVSELDDRTSEVTEYILQQQESLGETLDDLLVDVSGDTHMDIIKSMQLVSMTILADEHGGADPFAVLEYALDPDATDEVLLVNLDERRRSAVGDQRRLNLPMCEGMPRLQTAWANEASAARCARCAGTSRPCDAIDCAHSRPAR